MRVFLPVTLCRYFKVVLICSAALTLSGCATPYDAKIAQSNNDTVQNHDKQQGEVAKKKAESITGIFDKLAAKCENTDSFACGALLGMSGAMASRDIAGIKTEEYKGPMQKTGVDAQIKVVEKAEAIVNPMVTMVVATKAIDKDKGVVNNNASENSTVNNSYDEDHATAINTDEGSSTANNSPSGNHEEVVAPEPVVEE